MHVDRDASAVVRYGDAVVLVDRDLDFRAEAPDRLVDRVVDDFVDEVVQPIGSGRSDVHRRAFSNWVEAFENLD